MTSTHPVTFEAMNCPYTGFSVTQSQFPHPRKSVLPSMVMSSDVYFGKLERTKKVAGAVRDRHVEVPLSTRLKLYAMAPVVLAGSWLGLSSTIDFVNYIAGHTGANPAIARMTESHARLEALNDPDIAPDPEAIAQERQTMTEAVSEYLITTAQEAGEAELVDSINQLKGMLSAEDQVLISDLVSSIEEPGSGEHLRNEKTYQKFYDAFKKAHPVPPEHAEAVDKITQDILNDRTLETSTKILLAILFLMLYAIVFNNFFAAKAEQADDFLGTLGWRALQGTSATAKLLTLTVPRKIFPPIFHFFTELPMTHESQAASARRKMGLDFDDEPHGDGYGDSETERPWNRSGRDPDLDSPGGFDVPDEDPVRPDTGTVDPHDRAESARKRALSSIEVLQLVEDKLDPRIMGKTRGIALQLQSVYNEARLKELMQQLFQESWIKQLPRSVVVKAKRDVKAHILPPGEAARPGEFGLGILGELLEQYNPDAPPSGWRDRLPHLRRRGQGGA
ncbi:MAG: hypothetical protein VKJ04_11090 [Vampirovibrionales bacterium]|nr:hypothetical protein [Vampirovibrionales bacterium]